MDEMKRMNKGFMRKNGKTFLPVTHESLVLDNDGLSDDEKYLTKLEAEELATEDYVRRYVEQAQLGGGIDPDTIAKLEDLEKKVIEYNQVASKSTELAEIIDNKKDRLFKLHNEISSKTSEAKSIESFKEI